MLTQESANLNGARKEKPARGARDLSQSRLSLDEWEKIWPRCWRRIHSWRVLPRWNPLDWWDEARAEATLAGYTAALSSIPPAMSLAPRSSSTYPGRRLDALPPGMGLRPASSYFPPSRSMARPRMIRPLPTWRRRRSPGSSAGSASVTAGSSGNCSGMVRRKRPSRRIWG